MTGSGGRFVVAWYAMECEGHVARATGTGVGKERALLKRIAGFLLLVGWLTLAHGFAPGVIGQVHAESGSGAQPHGPSFAFRGLEFVGDVFFPEDELAGLFQPFIGMELDFAALEMLAAAVEALYAHHGYPFVIAYFPEQTVADGIVTMAIVVGRYGEVKLDNRSRLRESVARRGLWGTLPGDPIYMPALDERIARLNRLPGVAAEPVFAAGPFFGATDVIVEIVEAEEWSGSVTLGAVGPRLLDGLNIGASAHFPNPFGWGDQADVSVTTDGKSTVGLNATYERPLGPTLGYQLKSSLHWSGYRLTGFFEGLGGGGSGGFSLGVGRTLTLKSGLGVTGDLSLEHRQSRDVFVTSVTSHRIIALKAKVEWTAAESAAKSPAEPEARPFYRPERSHVEVVVGDLALGTPAQRQTDEATAKTAGLFGLVRAGAHWSVRLPSGLVTLRGSAQWAAKNLHGAEKFSIGGAVRARPGGRVSGDNGWSLQAEYTRQPFSVGAVPGRFLASAFIDAGGVTYNQSPWDATGVGGRNVMGAGVGVEWQPSADVTLRLQQAWIVSDSADVARPGDAGPLSLVVTYSF